MITSDNADLTVSASLAADATISSTEIRILLLVATASISCTRPSIAFTVRLVSVRLVRWVKVNQRSRMRASAAGLRVLTSTSAKRVNNINASWRGLPCLSNLIGLKHTHILDLDLIGYRHASDVNSRLVALA